MDSNDFRKIEVKDFKKELLDYFEKNSFDVTLLGVFNDLHLNSDQLNLLQYCLDILVEDGLIKKSSSIDHFEYDLEGAMN